MLLIPACFLLVLYGRRHMTTIRKAFTLLKATYAEWVEDQAVTHAAALAYYAMFALVPLLVIVISTAGLIFGQQAAQDRIVLEIETLLGHDSAAAISAMLEAARKPRSTSTAALIGVAALVIGSSGVFAQLQYALNTAWEAPPARGNGWLRLAKSRLLSFTMVLGTGFLLLVSLAVNAAISAFGDYLGPRDAGPALLGQAVNTILSFGIVTLLFAMIYKVLPDVAVAWSDVWIGAALTSVFFTAGKHAIGLYIGQSSVGVGFGAAGSIVVVMVWVFYSAQILLFGAEFTQVYAKSHGSWLGQRRGETPQRRRQGGRPDLRNAGAGGRTTGGRTGRSRETAVRRS